MGRAEAEGFVESLGGGGGGGGASYPRQRNLLLLTDDPLEPPCNR